MQTKPLIIDAEFEEVGPRKSGRWTPPYRALPRFVAFLPCLALIWLCAWAAMSTEDPAMRAAIVLIAALQWPIHRAFDWFWKALHTRSTQEEADDLRERIIGRRREL